MECKRGTRRVRLICTLFQNREAISPYRSSRFAPALSGLPPDPAPPSVMQSMIRLAACAPCLVAAVLGWRHGVGRLRRTVTCPSGALGGVVEHASNSPRRLRAIEHASRYPPRRAPSDKAGAGVQTTPIHTTPVLARGHERVHFG